MQRSKAIALRLIAMAALVPVVAACSSDLSLNNVTLVPKPETMLRKPDWATFSGAKSEFELRPVTSADLVAPMGQCPMVQGKPRASPIRPRHRPRRAGTHRGGIALQMTECDVVRRAGPVEKIDFGADERGDRTVALTYQRGPLPGIYRFTGGRLASIERAPGPPPAPPKQKATSKKPAGT